MGKREQVQRKRADGPARDPVPARTQGELVDLAPPPGASFGHHYGRIDVQPGAQVQLTNAQSAIQRRMVVENPGDMLPGTPPRQHWEEINSFISQISSTFSATSSGDINPSNAAACAGSPPGMAGQCLCDLHNSPNPEPWKIKIDERDWPHTEEANRRVTVHSDRSAMEFGAWGGGAQAGQRVMLDNPRVLAHELCGHAWLMERGAHPHVPPSGGGRPGHDPTVVIENAIATEMRGPGAPQRGLFADPHHGESFARVTATGFPTNVVSASSLPPGQQAHVDVVVDFMTREPAVKADIIGHADHTGSDAVNQRVALSRAEAMRAALAGRGIRPNRFLAVRGRGDTECPPTPEDNPDCRKVEVFMYIFDAASESSP
jgi:hypothetical protein